MDKNTYCSKNLPSSHEASRRGFFPTKEIAICPSTFTACRETVSKQINMQSKNKTKPKNKINIEVAKA